MKTISKYVKNNTRFEKLESPYMNYRTTSNKVFDEMFKKFVVALATSDAEYGKKEQLGATQEDLDKIIEDVKNKLKNIISKIETDEEKKSFVLVMQKIKDCGDFGNILYNSCNVSSLEPDLAKKEKEKFNNLIFVVEYMVIKVNKILMDETFSDYDILISDIATNVEKLESYVKSPEYSIEKIRELQDKLMNLSKQLRDKKASKISDITYADCKINTTNENLKFECEKICALLLYLDSDDDLDDVYNSFYKSLSFIESEDEFNEFIIFIKQLKEAGVLGRKFYNSKTLNIRKLSYESIRQINNTDLNQSKLFDDVRLTVAAAVEMCEEEFKDNISLEILDDLITILYEQNSILSGLNQDEEIIEFEKKLKELISHYENKKQSLSHDIQNKI